MQKFLNFSEMELDEATQSANQDAYIFKQETISKFQPGLNNCDLTLSSSNLNSKDRVHLAHMISGLEQSHITPVDTAGNVTEDYHQLLSQLKSHEEKKMSNMRNQFKRISKPKKKKSTNTENVPSKESIIARINMLN